MDDTFEYEGTRYREVPELPPLNLERYCSHTACRGCCFEEHRLLEVTCVDAGNLGNRCCENSTVFIPDTPEGYAAYIAARLEG
jgi:hypothetical protein